MINIKATKTKLEAMKLLRSFDKVKIDEENYSISIHDFEEDHSFAAVYIWDLVECRAYSEDLTHPFSSGDNIDGVASATEFTNWVNSFY